MNNIQPDKFKPRPIPDAELAALNLENDNIEAFRKFDAATDAMNPEAIVGVLASGDAMMSLPDVN